MKQFTSIAIAFLLVLSVLPAMAGDQTGSRAVDQTVNKATVSFQAFSKLSDTERQSLAPLTDTELASIEGATSESAIKVAQVVSITQTNINTGNATGVGIGGVFGNGTGLGIIDQSNSARVNQRIN